MFKVVDIYIEGTDECICRNGILVGENEYSFWIRHEDGSVSEYQKISLYSYKDTGKVSNGKAIPVQLSLHSKPVGKFGFCDLIYDDNIRFVLWHGGNVFGTYRRDCGYQWNFPVKKEDPQNTEHEYS